MDSDRDAHSCFHSYQKVMWILCNLHHSFSAGNRLVQCQTAADGLWITGLALQLRGRCGKLVIARMQVRDEAALSLFFYSLATMWNMYSCAYEQGLSPLPLRYELSWEDCCGLCLSFSLWREKGFWDITFQRRRWSLTMLYFFLSFPP